MQTNCFMLSAAAAALVLYALVASTNPKPAPWWRFWDPRSGLAGGLLLSLLAVGAYATFKAAAEGWFA